MATPQLQDLVQMLARSIAQFGPREALGTRRGERWEWTTYAELGKLVEDFRAGLASLGIQRGERVAIISDNRVELAVAAYACYGLGAAVVPIYQSQDEKERAYIVKDCEA